MSRFSSTPDVWPPHSTHTSSELLHYEAKNNSNATNESGMNQVSSSSVRVKVEPLSVPLVNRSHKLKMPKEITYKNDEDNNHVSNKRLADNLNFFTTTPSLIRNKSNNEISLPTPLHVVVSPIQEASSLHDVLQSYNEECQELASLLANYSPITLLEKEEEASLPQPQRLEQWERQDHYCEEEEEEFVMPERVEVKPSRKPLPLTNTTVQNLENVIVSECVLSPMSIDTCNTVHNTENHNPNVVNSNNKQAVLRESIRYSSSSRPLAPSSLHDERNVEITRTPFHEIANSTNINPNTSNITEMCRKNECVLINNKEKEISEHITGWLLYLLTCYNKSLQLIEQQCKYSTHHHSIISKCVEAHSLHQQIIQLLTALMKDEDVIIDSNNNNNNIIDDTDDIDDTVRNINLINRHNTKMKTHEFDATSEKHIGNKQSQMCIELSNNLAVFTATFDKIVIKLCKLIKSERASLNNSSSSNKQKHSHNLQAENCNSKHATALITESTLRHEALYCAERNKMQGALTLSHEREKALEMEKEQILLELDEWKKTFQTLQEENKILQGQYTLLKEENRKLRCKTNNNNNDGKSCNNITTTNTINNEKYKDSHDKQNKSNEEYEGNKTFEREESSLSSLSCQSSSSSSYVSNSTARPVKVETPLSNKDKIIAALKKELQNVNNENDALHNTIDELRKTISKHHRVLELLMEHNESFEYRHSHHTKYHNKGIAAKQHLLSPDVIKHMLSHDN